MRLMWNNKAVECRQVKILPSNVRAGDFMLYHGEVVKVETIQRDCPRIENLSHKFTMFVLVTRNNEKILADSVVGQRDVFRRTR